MRFVALIYLTLLLAATVCAYKVVKIGPISEPGSTLIYTFSFFWGNVFAEVYGSTLSKKLIWESIGCGYLFAILIAIVGLLPSSSEYFPNQGYLESFFGHVLRFTMAGSVGFLITSFLNVYIITKWKYKMHGRLFWLRSLVASTLSDGLATFIAGIITFFNMMPMEKILALMTNALLFKIAYGFVAVWPASFIAFVLKKREKEVYSNATINPFNFKD